jgi:hypothetical protein
VELPETHYATSGGVSIAYQVLGDGPFDIVYVPGFVSHLELRWRVPSFSASLAELKGIRGEWGLYRVEPTSVD